MWFDATYAPWALGGLVLGFLLAWWLFRRQVREVCTGKVCAVFYWGNYGGFYHYMGRNCDTNEVGSLVTEAPLAITSCDPGPCVNCVDIGMHASKGQANSAGTGKRFGDKHAYHHDDLERGIPHGHLIRRPTADILQRERDGFRITNPSRLFAWLELNQAGTQRAKVELLLVTITHPEMAPRGFSCGAGGEVLTGDNPTDGTIPFSATTHTHGKCLLVSHGGNDYIVIRGE